MYEARQNKEKVSRRIENKPLKQSDENIVQMTQMPDDKISELKTCPESFTDITLFHGDNRNYLKEIGISTVDTSDWDKGKQYKQRIIDSIADATNSQKEIYELVKDLSERDFNIYINKWIHNPNEGFFKTNASGQQVNLIKQNNRFNGCCCCLKKEKAQGRHVYEINLNGQFNRIKKSPIAVIKNALYECGDIKLQFANINTDQGEVDILSPVPSDCIELL
jgi:hypothetical protein|nr:MAG TPA: hypothetical protein [Caudoviricetes sp.]